MYPTGTFIAAVVEGKEERALGRYSGARRSRASEERCGQSSFHAPVVECDLWREDAASTEASTRTILTLSAFGMSWTPPRLARASWYQLVGWEW